MFTSQSWTFCLFRNASDLNTVSVVSQHDVLLAEVEPRRGLILKSRLSCPKSKLTCSQTSPKIRLTRQDKTDKTQIKSKVKTDMSQNKTNKIILTVPETKLTYPKSS